jgi:hypothetical protein
MNVVKTGIEIGIYYLIIRELQGLELRGATDRKSTTSELQSQR